MNLTEELREYAERLSQSTNPNPEVSALLIKAADALEEALDNRIELLDSSGNHFATIDQETSEFIRQQAISQYIEDVLRRAIEEHDKQS